VTQSALRTKIKTNIAFSQPQHDRAKPGPVLFSGAPRTLHRVLYFSRLHRHATIMSIDFPKEEESVLRRWKEIKAFERQVELSEGRERFTFYDGPPFAT
jgi:hypothetical protein